MTETGDNLGRNASSESNANVNNETCNDLGRNVWLEDIFNHKFPEGLRVLAVDDSVVCLTLLSALLKKCHYEVTETTKATEALEILRKNKDNYDIVLTDVNMLDMDGFELLQIVTVEMDIPVIMISANEDTKSVMRSIEEGAVDYLLKPVRIEELKNIWQHLVRKKQKTNQNLLPLQRQGKGSTGKKEDKMSVQSDSESNTAHKKPRLMWTTELHQKFVGAVQQIGLDNASPKKILRIMNEPWLTRWKVASHLQKYRALVKKESEKAEIKRQNITYYSSNGADGDTITSFPHAQGLRQNFPRMVDELVDLSHFPSFDTRNVVSSSLSSGLVPHSAPSNVNSIHAPSQMLGDALLPSAMISRRGSLGMMIASSSQEQNDISNFANGRGDENGFPFNVQGQIYNYPAGNIGRESEEDYINFNWIEDDHGAILDQFIGDSDLWL